MDLTLEFELNLIDFDLKRRVYCHIQSIFKEQTEINGIANVQIPLHVWYLCNQRVGQDQCVPKVCPPFGVDKVQV